MKNMSRKSKSESKSIAKMIMVCCVFLFVGVVVAYYNTASFGYDNANLFSYDTTAVYFLFFDIKFEKIFKIIQYLYDFVPKVFMTI